MAEEHRPGPGQLQIESLAVPASYDLERLNTFSHVATPEYWGLDLEKYWDIEQDKRIIEAASPDKFRKSLIGIPRNSPGFGLEFTPDYERRPVRVALTPTEFELMSGSIMQLGAKVVSRTLKLRPDRSDFEHNNATAERAGVHAVTNKLEKLTAFRDNVLNPDIQRLDRFMEAAKHPGLARGKELGMREEMTWVMERIFGDMLIALRHVRQWTPEQADLAERAVEYRLFLDRSHNRHLGNWRGMLNLASVYNKNKRSVCNERIRIANKYITDHQPTEVQ